MPPHLFWMVQNPTQQQTFRDYWQIQKNWQNKHVYLQFPTGH